MLKEGEPRTITEKEIVEAIQKIRKINLAMWGRLMRSNRNEEEIKPLYRYREGFDSAILNLAKTLKISLNKKQPVRADKGEKKLSYIKNVDQVNEMREGKFPLCSSCEAPLFKHRKNVWFCPACDMKFLLRE